MKTVKKTYELPICEFGKKLGIKEHVHRIDYFDDGVNHKPKSKKQNFVYVEVVE